MSNTLPATLTGRVLDRFICLPETTGFQLSFFRCLLLLPIALFISRRQCNVQTSRCAIRDRISSEAYNDFTFFADKEIRFFHKIPPSTVINIKSAEAYAPIEKHHAVTQ